jgi:hypothetical protein
MAVVVMVMSFRLNDIAVILVDVLCHLSANTRLPASAAVAPLTQHNKACLSRQKTHPPTW